MNEDQEKLKLYFALGLKNKHGKSLDEVTSKVVEKMITLHAFGVSRSDAQICVKADSIWVQTLFFV